MTHIERLLAEHLHFLSATIGPRPAGSAANAAAEGYIARTLVEYGYGVERQPYACAGWEDHGTTLLVAGEPAAAAANPFSPPCDLEAPSVPVGTLAELRAAALRGRVAVLYGALAAAPLAPKAWPFRGEGEAEAVALLEAKAPAAILAVQAGAGMLPRLTEDDALAIPAATVPAEVGLALVQRPGLRVRLRIEARRAPATAANVVGQIGSDESRVVLCAHFDTKVDTPGAADNASGVAVLLALGRLLAQHRLRHGVELVAFNGEEYLPLGDDAYLARRGGGLGQVVALINFDAVGLWLAPNSVAMLGAAEPFVQAVQRLALRHPGLVWAPPWVESNHGSFAARGVPCVAFTAAAPPPLYHTRADSERWLSPARMREAALVGAEIVALLQHHDPAWARPEPHAARP